MAVAAVWDRAPSLPELWEWQFDPLNATRRGMLLLCAPGYGGDVGQDLALGNTGTIFGSAFITERTLPLLRPGVPQIFEALR